jgi:hypothetical protein
MQAQEGESRKNYIGIVSDGIEQRRTVEPSAKSDRPMKDYLVRLMALVLDPRREVR